VRAQRLDLGVDVVVVPDKDLLFVHPDLSFGQAVGSVMAALPDMHPDVAVNLVAQVSQRPQPRRFGWRLSATTVAALAAVAGVLVLGQGSDPYGERWKNAVTELGLTCQHAPDQHTCTGEAGTRYQVTAYTRDDGALYVLRSDGNLRYVRAFTEPISAAWREANPAAVPLSSQTATWR
jgi:hypothetical protein